MRVATFNLENLDETTSPSLETRIQVLRPQLRRLNADILCLQEVNGQERPGQKRQLLALEALLADTPYADGYSITTTLTSNHEPYNERNLVILSKYPLLTSRQIRNDYVGELLYRRITAVPHEAEAKEVSWERPILHVRVDHPQGPIDIINLHLKSRIPTPIPGQKEGPYAYKTVEGWGEGYFISSMKRVGQALEARFMIDELLNDDPNARIIICGDFNSEPGDVPVEAIAGRIENTGNAALGFRQMISCSNSIPKASRYSHLHEEIGRAHV